MRQLLLWLSILTALAQPALAQPPSFRWAKGVQGSNLDDGRDVVVDAAGNVYVTGYFAGTTDFDPGPATFNLTAPATGTAGNYNAYVLKLDSGGAFLWARMLGGVGGSTGESIVLDPAGRVCITGSFGGSADFDPGPGVATLTSTGLLDVFVCKLDANGGFVWARGVGGALRSDVGYAIGTDAAANIFVAGSFTGTADFDPGPAVFNLSSAGNANVQGANSDAFVMKLDSAGGFLWAGRMGSDTIDNAYTLAVTPGGDVLVGGDFSDTADFDPGAGVFELTTATVGVTDAFVAKLSASGALVWAKSVARGANGESAYSLDYDVAGDIYVGGIFGSPATDFDPGPASANLATVGFGDIFISKLDSSGNYLWARGIGSGNDDFARGLAVDASGNLCVTGLFRSTADFDPGPGTANLSSSGVGDVFVLRLDGAGNYLWAGKMGATGAELGYAIAPDAGGRIHVVGIFRGTVDFDPTAGVTTLTAVSSPGADVFLVKLSFCGQSPLQPGAVAGNTAPCQGTSQTYSVQPMAGAAFYSWTLPAGWSGISTTNSISVVAGTAGGTITVSAGNGCGQSPVQTLAISVLSAPPQPGAITGAGNPCSGTLQTYSVAPVSGALSYHWTLPAGWSGTSVGNSIAAVVGAGGGNISAAAVNVCDTSSTQVFAVSVAANPVVTVTQSGATLDAGGGFSSYQWYLNGTPIPGATAQTYVAVGSGAYHVVVTNVANCTGQSTVVTFTLGLPADLSGRALSIFPNPVRDVLHIAGLQDSATAHLYDCVGRSVAGSPCARSNSSGCELDVAHLPAGLYILEAGGVFVRLVKE